MAMRDHAHMDTSTVIRQARKRAGITQAELAKKMSVVQSAVSQWESGRTIPDLPNRILLSEILKIPFVSLLPEAKELAEELAKDPQTLQLIYNYIKLPPPMRTAVLLNVLGLLEALEQGR